MINCRIISVNTDIEDDLKSVKEFGHKTDNAGNKIRYVIRRNLVSNFIKNENIAGMKLSISNAVTPAHFLIKDKKVFYDSKVFNLDEKFTIFGVANVLSNMKIWEIEEDTLILEDDVILEKEKLQNLLPLIEEFKKIKSKKAILYLQLSCPWRENKPRIYDTFKTEYIHFEVPTDKSDCSGTAAYFIKKETKKLILDMREPLFGTDGYLGQIIKKNKLLYLIPTNRNLMLELNQENYWI